MTPLQKRIRAAMLAHPEMSQIAVARLVGCAQASVSRTAARLPAARATTSAPPPGAAKVRCQCAACRTLYEVPLQKGLPLPDCCGRGVLILGGAPPLKPFPR